jgi:hypothetical protein
LEFDSTFEYEKLKLDFNDDDSIIEIVVRKRQLVVIKVDNESDDEIVISSLESKSIDSSCQIDSVNIMVKTNLPEYDN